MSRLISLIIAVFSSAVLAGCITPSATSPSKLFEPPPSPKMQQYSDYLIGQYAHWTNDPELAAERSVQASKQLPHDGLLLEHAVRFQLIAGNAKDAVSLVRKGQHTVDELGSVSRLTLAAYSMRKGQLTRAKQLLSSRDIDRFNRIPAKGMSAWAAMGEGDLAGARTYLLESFVGDNLFDGVTLYMMAFIEASLGEDEAAMETFQATWENRMRLAIAAEYYARMLAERGFRDEALEIVSEFRDEIGPNPAVDSLQADIVSGRTVRAPKLTPAEGASLSLYSIGSALSAQGQKSYAAMYFELALYVNPDLDLARSMLGDIFDSSGRRSRALDILDDVNQQSPFFATSQGQKAWVLLRDSQDEAALKSAERAYGLTGDRDLAIQIGDINRALGDPDEAFRWFDKVVQKDLKTGRKDWRSFYARGLALDALDRWDEAEADFKTSVSINGDQPDVLNYLGYSWVDRGIHLEEAFKLIQHAVKLSPGQGHIVDSLGWAYYRLGQYDLAVKHLERAVTLAAGDPTINDHLGDAYWRSGRHLEAGFQWRHALELEPDIDGKAKIQAKLNHGLDAVDNQPVTVVSTETTQPALP